MTIGCVRVGARDTKQVRFEIHLIPNDAANHLSTDEAKNMPPLLYMTDSFSKLTVKLGIFQTFMAFRISVWSRVCFCNRCHSEGILAINVADIGPTGEASANPAGRGHLRNEVLGLLNIILYCGNHRGKDAVKLLLSDCATLLAHAHLLGVEQQRLDLGIAASTTHIGHTQKGPGLRTDIAPLIIELGLILQYGFRVNLPVVRAESLARIHQQLPRGHGIHGARIGDKISSSISAGAHRLLVVLLYSTRIVLGVCKPVDLHL